MPDIFDYSRLYDRASIILERDLPEHVRAHSRRVAFSLQEDGMRFAMLGLLHDYIEDHPEGPDQAQLDLQFVDLPEEDIHVLQALTHWEFMSYAEYIDAVLDNGAAAVVKVRDMLDNIGRKPRGVGRENSLRRRYYKVLPRLLEVADKYRLQVS